MVRNELVVFDFQNTAGIKYIIYGIRLPETFELIAAPDSAVEGYARITLLRHKRRTLICDNYRRPETARQDRFIKHCTRSFTCFALLNCLAVDQGLVFIKRNQAGGFRDAVILLKLYFELDRFKRIVIYPDTVLLPDRIAGDRVVVTVVVQVIEIQTADLITALLAARKLISRQHGTNTLFERNIIIHWQIVFIFDSVQNHYQSPVSESINAIRLSI